MTKHQKKRQKEHDIELEDCTEINQEEEKKYNVQTLSIVQFSKSYNH